jgi:hypothetical protein
VNPFDTIARWVVCSGGSMFSRISRWISISSRSISGPNRMIAVFSAVENTSLLRTETSLTSS